MKTTRIQKTNGQKSPTIQDVARQAGVSTATVSRVLADQDGVSPETRQRVYESVRILNYQLNRNARNLRKSTTTKIGVIISDIQNPFFGSVVRGIEKVTIAGEYAIILGNSDENPEREKKLLSILLEEGVAGIILAPTSPNCDAYNELQGSGIPVVVIDRKIEPCWADTVVVNGYAGAQSAVEKLIQLGHKRIGFVGGIEYLSVMREREQGYRDALMKYSISISERLIRHGNNRQDGGAQAVRDLLGLEQPPSALLIANNLMTLGGLQVIHQMGIKIPEEISLIGFDDMDWASSLKPPLTVVAQPDYEMGEAAAEVLLQRIQATGRPLQQIRLETRLIERQSCSRYHELVEGSS